MTHVTGLRLINWQRFRGNHVLELGPGTWAITAQDERDEGRSNWLGKSALLKALRWLLEGHKPREVDTLDELISWGENEMGVEGELSDGTFISRLKKRDRAVDLCVELSPEAFPWTRGGRGDLGKLYKDPAQDVIWKNVIGLTSDDLLNTAYAEQKQLAQLVSIKGTGLHDIVTGWLRLEPLVAASDAAYDELAKLTAQLNATQTELQNLEADPILTSSVDELRARVTELEAAEQDFEQRRLQTQQRVRAHDEWLRLKERRDEAERARAEVERLERELAVLPKPKGDKAKLDAAVLAASNEHETKRREHEQKQTLAAGLFNGCCPVNGEQCPIAKSINEQRTKNTQLAATAKTERDVAYTALQAAAAPLNLHTTLSAAVDRANTRLQQARASFNRIAPLLERPLPEEPDVVDIVLGVGQSLELDQARKQLERYEFLTKKLAALCTDIEQLKASVRVVRAGAAILGPEKAQRLIAERATKIIERVANADLAKAGIDLSLAVRWGRETQQPARQCPKCGTAFPPSTRVKVCAGCLAPRGMAVKPELRFKLSNVSGAADDLAGLALRCSAFKWLRARRGAQWSVAVLDEPFGSLDRTNKRALAAHVQSMLAGTFEQSIIVAHDAAILDAMANRIVITGRGKWSDVRVAD